MISFKRLDHILITIPPGTRHDAKKFYAEVLGLNNIEGNHPNGAIWLTIADIELHIREEENHPVNSSRHPAFEVDDLDAAKLFLQKQSIPLSYSTDIDGRERCFFRDPWGNRFELIEYLK